MKPRKGYIYQRGDVYWVQYRVDGKLFRESLGTTSERKAKTAAADKLAPYAAKAEAERLGVIAARLKAAKNCAASATARESLLGAWPAFLAIDKEDRPNPGPATLAMYVSLWNTFSEWIEKSAPAIKTLAHVRESHAKAFVHHLNKSGLSVGRVNKYKRFLKMFFRVMLAGGDNPFGGVATQRDNQTSKQTFTVEEMRKIVEMAEGEMRTLYLLGAGTGLRFGDCCTLMWGECDVSRRMIERVPRKTAHLGDEDAKVKIGIPYDLAAHLAALPRSSPYVLPGLAAEYLAGKAPNIAHRIQNHLTACGIQTTKPGTGEGSGEKDLGGKPIPGTAKRAVVLKGFHSFRHTFVSLNADFGTPQATMTKLVGHGNPQMTMRYLHPTEGMVLKAADAVPALLGAGAAKPVREPLPAWAIEAAKNAKTLKELRALLLT